MEFFEEEKYDETTYPVLSKTHGGDIRMQKLYMADYIHEQVYLNLSQILGQ